MARILLSEQTANHIKEVIDAQHKPGDRIPSEIELADFLGVSRTTVREAVKILCSRDILEIRRGQGTYVRDNPGVPSDPFGTKSINKNELEKDIFEMSVLLEPELVRLSARKADEDSIEKMKAVYEEYLILVKRKEAGEYIPAKEFRKNDVKFHKAVINGCQNQIIIRSLPMFIESCAEWYNVWTNSDTNKALESFATYHPKILAAIEAHDGESAYNLSLEHTREVIEAYRVK